MTTLALALAALCHHLLSWHPWPFWVFFWPLHYSFVLRGFIRRGEVLCKMME